MKISQNWLSQFITTHASTETLSNTLTEIGLEVEGIEEITPFSSSLKGVIVAEVQEVFPHPNADKLKLCKVFDGNETQQIVCGAPNVAANQKVALATIGTQLHLKNGEVLTIKKSKIRGEESFGMLCSEEELGLSKNHQGIMILDEMAEIGTPLKDYLIEQMHNDFIFEIGLTPNRTDAMSHYGVARDLNAGLQQRNIKAEFLPINDSFLFSNTESPTFKVILENENCKRYSLAYIENVKVKPSPQWLQTLLKNIGLEPINNIVDITNYVLHSYGQPLHAFDAAKIKDQTIIVGNNEAETPFVTLDKVQRKLHSEDLMIKDGQQTPLCIAGVLGGVESGISDTTTSIVLESAYFDSVSVRKTAKRHGLNTDASFRFERGVDPELTLFALKKACELIIDLAEGTLNEQFIDENKFSTYRHTVFLHINTLNSIAGIQIHRENISKILKLLDISIILENDLGFELEIPAYRVDVTREIDVVEEILRIYGYNNIPSAQKFHFSLTDEHFQQHKIENILSDLLIENGYFELMNNSLTSSLQREDEIALLNPLSNDLAVMRRSMLPNILKNIEYNINRNQNNLKFFEFGKIYHQEKGKYIETPKLALALTGNFVSENWFEKSQAVSIFHLKGIVYAIFEKLGISVEDNIEEVPYLTQSISILSDSKSLAVLGKVTPKMAQKQSINQPILYAELDMISILSVLPSEKFKLQPIPKFPGTRRDLALLLNQEVLYKDLKEVAFTVDHHLLKHVNLFDEYTGEKLPKGKKSYAISYEFLDETQTITDAQVDKIIQKIIKEYEKQFKAELRT